MSRAGKWQPPTQSGTELFPTQKAGPTVVRFAGVQPGSRLAERLLGQLLPQINAFHRQQAHNHSLGGLDYTKTRRELPGFALSYANVSGQEYITVNIGSQLMEQLKKQAVPPKMYYQWMIVDLFVLSPYNLKNPYGSASCLGTTAEIIWDRVHYPDTLIIDAELAIKQTGYADNPTPPPLYTPPYFPPSRDWLWSNATAPAQYAQHASVIVDLSMARGEAVDVVFNIGWFWADPAFNAAPYPDASNPQTLVQTRLYAKRNINWQWLQTRNFPDEPQPDPSVGVFDRYGITWADGDNLSDTYLSDLSALSTVLTPAKVAITWPPKFDTTGVYQTAGNFYPKYNAGAYYGISGSSAARAGVVRYDPKTAGVSLAAV